MHLRRLPPAAVILAMLASAVHAAGPAPAHDAKSDVRNELVRLYTMSVVLDTCGGIDVSDDEESRLEKAISNAEGKLSLTMEASEALYNELLIAADNDKAAFCAKYATVIKATLQQLPE